MTDTDSTHLDDDGDAPDTFEGRIVVIIRLIDTAPEEQTEDRQVERRALVLRLLIMLQQDMNDRISELLDRFGEL